VRFPLRANDVTIRGGEVHVWRTDLRPPARSVAVLRGILDPEERACADRFVFDEHRVRYVVAHGLLRHLLGGYLRMAPEAVRFSRARHGKPYLASHTDRGQGAVLRFNLAHSGDRALIAVGVGREVGIDVEEVRRDRDLVGIAGRFFSPAEAAALKALPAHHREAGFYRCWTRKEAYMKACGEGMAMRLDSFDVLFEPDAPAALLRSERGVDEPRRWQIVELAAGAGFAAALAVEGDDWQLVAHALELSDDPE
jgi:4'-phosphopantetheinyl transferase